MSRPTGTAWRLTTLDKLVDILDYARVPVSAKEREKRPGRTPYFGAVGQVGWIDSPLFNEELVLLGEDGVQFFDVSKPKAYRVDGPAWVNNHAHVLRARTSHVSSGYLTHYLNQVDYRGFANGTTRLKLTQASMRRIPVRLPGLAEQRRIVDTLEDHLSRLDAANDLLHRSTRRLVNLRQSTLSAVVDGPGRRRIPLADLVVRVETGRSFGGAASPATPGEWGIIKVSAMTWGSFRPEENKAVRLDQANRRHEIHEGDLLISRANTSTYVGASVLVGPTRPQLLLSDKSLRLIPRPGIDVRWLQLALSTPRTRSQISAAATGTKDSMRNISQTALLRTELPDRTSEQQRRDVRAVLERLASAEALEQSVNLVQQRAKVQRRSLLASAFDGRLTGSSTAEAIGDDLAGSGDGDRRRRPSRSSTRWNCANGSG